MYMREQKRKYLRKVAKSYFLEQRRFKCLKCWRTVIVRERNHRDNMLLRIKEEVPYAAEIVLELLAARYYI